MRLILPHPSSSVRAPLKYANEGSRGKRCVRLNGALQMCGVPRWRGDATYCPNLVCLFWNIPTPTPFLFVCISRIYTALRLIVAAHKMTTAGIPAKYFILLRIFELEFSDCRTVCYPFICVFVCAVSVFTCCSRCYCTLQPYILEYGSLLHQLVSLKV